MADFVFKTKQPHDHIEEAVSKGQARTRALVRKLSDQSILELADVLSEFTEAAREREEARLSKGRQVREMVCHLNMEFYNQGGAEWAINRMMELGLLAKYRGRRRKNQI